MPRRTHVVVSYDISDDSLRTSFAEELKNLGLNREQYSLFTGYVPVKRVNSVRDAAEDYREKEEDCRIKLIPLCQRCVEKSIEFPETEEATDDFTVI